MKLKKIDYKRDFLTIKKLLFLKGHLGQHKMLANPKMFPYILGERQKRYIINLEKSFVLFQRGLNFLRSCFKKRKKILFLGSPMGQKKKFETFLSKNRLSFIQPNHWMGGLLTNWIDHKKYRRNFMRNTHSFKENELQKFIKNFDGLRFLHTKPDVIVIFNVMETQDVQREAYRLNIPVVAFLDTHENPDYIDYPIPLNTQSEEIGLFLFRIFFTLISFYKRKKSVWRTKASKVTRRKTLKK
jgi:small subunit ribosomal protein S2